MRTRHLRHISAFGLLPLSIIAVSFFGFGRVPLYDGLGFPDEPYRYISPPTPAQQTTLSATAVTVSSPVASNTNTNLLDGSSGESGPQAALYIPAHAFSISSSSAHSVTASAVPLAPDGSQPSGDTIVGNIYHVGFTSDAGTATLQSGSGFTSYAILRLPQGYSSATTMVYRTRSSSSWIELSTQQIGADIYSAAITGAGDVAMAINQPASVVTSPSTPTQSSANNGQSTPQTTPTSVSSTTSTPISTNTSTNTSTNPATSSVPGVTQAVPAEGTAHHSIRMPVIFLVGSVLVLVLLVGSVRYGVLYRQKHYDPPQLP